MRSLMIALFFILAGWMFIRLSYQAQDNGLPGQAQQTVTAQPQLNDTGAAVMPGVSGRGDVLDSMLQRYDFDAAVQRYETVKDKQDEMAAVTARLQILHFSRYLITAKHFNTAEQLLQSFLRASHRDVEARMLLAEVYLKQGNYSLAIDQFYEARGYSFKIDSLQKINGQIRTRVANLSKTLEASGDFNTLLAVYQKLTQLEPDYAPWFIGLATAEIGLEDFEAARRSLLLITQDTNVGASARAMLLDLENATYDVDGVAKQESVSMTDEIPLSRAGNHFIVDARQGNGLDIRLLIDTGASMTILKPEILEEANLRYTNTGRTAVFNTANGPVQAPVYLLDSLSVGNWKVSQLEAGVMDLGGSQDIDGLLGMNFLQHFQFFIDQKEALLRLSVN